MENGAEFAPSRELEDALGYLPRKALSTYRKGQVIFDERHPTSGIHLVVQGRVMVTIHFEDGSETSGAARVCRTVKVAIATKDHSSDKQGSIAIGESM